MGLRDRLRTRRSTTDVVAPPAIPAPLVVNNLWVEPHTSPDPNHHIVYGHNEEHYREVVIQDGKEVISSVRGTSDMTYHSPEAVAELKAEAAELHAAGKTIGIHTEEYLAAVAAGPKLSGLDEHSTIAAGDGYDSSHEL